MTVDQLTRIDNQVLIHAPRPRVWKALTTPSDFSKWFHATLTATEFAPGKRVDLVSTYPGHEGSEFFFEVIEVAPEHRFAWRWQHGEKPSDPFTTVTFNLEEVEGGTLVKVSETGSDQLSLEKRAKAFEGNTKGWELQMQNIHDYVEQNR